MTILKFNCPHCSFIGKNANGLRLHSRKHKNEKPLEALEEKQEEKQESAEYTIAEVVVPNTGEVILTYSLENHGKDFITLATNMAQRKNLEVRFK